ncbi:GFA family protein [Inquilinus limosus]|uniref:GFA family protein n=1 Tax=Inquilinus limosus TaxID=171674 RepID=UPI003F1471C1
MPDFAMPLTGGCGCGAVRYAVSGAPGWVAACHCRDCRRITGAPYSVYAGFDRGRVSWSGEAPRRFESSPGAVRFFCGRCGTPLAYEGVRWPDEVHLLVTTLDDPAALPPQGHVYVGQKLPWVHLSDGLPRYRTTASEGGPMADDE